jgi:hypothetical protein
LQAAADARPIDQPVQTAVESAHWPDVGSQNEVRQVVCTAMQRAQSGEWPAVSDSHSFWQPPVSCSRQASGRVVAQLVAHSSPYCTVTVAGEPQPARAHARTNHFMR